MSNKKKVTVAEIISKLADLEAEIDIMKNNKEDFTDKEIKSLQNKFYKLNKKLDNMPDSKNESLVLNENSIKIEEAKKRKVNRKIKINEDKNKFTTTKVDDEEKLKELYEDNSFVLLGIDTSESNLESLANILEDAGHLKNDIVTFYIIKGSLLNKIFNINDYKSNLNIIAIKQEDLSKIDELKNSTMYQLSVCTNWMKNLIDGYGIENVFDNDDDELEEKDEIKESVQLNESNILDELEDGLYLNKEQYIKTNEGYMEIEIDPTAPSPEEYDQGFLPEYGGNEEELNKAKETYENGEVIVLRKLEPEEVYAYVYTKDSLEKILDQLDAVKVNIKDLMK